MLIPLLNGTTREFIPGPGRGFTTTEPRVGTVFSIPPDYAAIRTSLGLDKTNVLQFWRYQEICIKADHLHGTLDKEDYVHEL